MKNTNYFVLFIVSILIAIALTLYTHFMATYNFGMENVDMNKVVSIEATETGAYIQFDDGTGYYWEKQSDTGHN